MCGNSWSMWVEPVNIHTHRSHLATPIPVLARRSSSSCLCEQDLYFILVLLFFAALVVTVQESALMWCLTLHRDYFLQTRGTNVLGGQGKECHCKSAFQLKLITHSYNHKYITHYYRREYRKNLKYAHQLFFHTTECLNCIKPPLPAHHYVAVVAGPSTLRNLWFDLQRYSLPPKGGFSSIFLSQAYFIFILLLHSVF